MRYVFLFPGQGSQTHRMGFELYRDLPECRRVFDQAGDEIKSRIFEGRAADLQKTEHLQPAISVVNAACLAALVERGVRADAVAGHSLGEYSAAYAAGVLELEDLIAITTKRGALMAAAAATSPGSMLAVSGLSDAQCAEVVEKSASAGIICIANFNSPDQVVLSGEHGAISRAGELASAMGARKVSLLPVSGAWHSPLMTANRHLFEIELQALRFRDAEIDLYSNVTAEPTRDGATIRELLVRQYDSSVRWSDTIRNMIRDYPDAEFVEVGPGRVLTGLLLAIDRSRVVHRVDSPSSLNSFLRKAGK
jgi:[acyl-carrier-protein] S-malonyltransferase